MAARMEREATRRENEELKRRHEMFVQGKITWHAMMAFRERPPSEKPKKGQEPDYQAAKKFNEWRDEHDDAIRKAFGVGGDPYHFETFAHFSGHLFPEPPSEEEIRAQREQTAEEKRAETLAMLESMWDGPPAPDPETPPDGP